MTSLYNDADEGCRHEGDTSHTATPLSIIPSETNVTWDKFIIYLTLNLFLYSNRCNLFKRGCFHFIYSI